MAALCASALLVAASHGAAAASGVSIALADAPASARDPRATFYVVDHVVPGTTLERTVHVQNDGDAPVELELYVGGSSVRGSRLTFDDHAADVSELATWSRLVPDRVSLAPHAGADAVASIAVPETARDGERLGVIWAQTPGTAGSASIVNRVGVRVYLSVGASGAPPTELRVDSLTASRGEDGAAVVTATIANTGGRAIEPTGTVSLSGAATASAPIAPGLTLLPGDAASAAARFTDEVGAAPVDAVVTVAANGVEERVRATLTFPTEPGSAAEPVRVDADDGAGTTGPAIVAALLAVTALVATLRTRQRRKR